MPQTRIQFGLRPLTEVKVPITRTVLPLKGVDCRFAAQGGLVEVVITQLFRQENSKPLDCQYVFPLPADAAVYACEAFINDRVIRARIEEREQARALAQEKKAAGYRTALVESERENLFTLTLTNLQPEDLIEVRLAYIQPLRRLAGQFSIEIPFCPGVRYIPGRPLLRSNRGRGFCDDTDQVPDASRITPPRIDAEHPDAAFVEVQGELDAAFLDPASLASPSHVIATEAREGLVRVALALHAEVPDRDFVLRWQEQPAAVTTPRAWVHRKGEETYALLEIRAPDVKAPGGAAPQDVYFLVDRSGSMQGEKWLKAAAALQSYVAVLDARDRVMVTLFESSFQDFAEGPLPAAQVLSDPNFRQLQQLGTAGGTELGPALTHVLEVARRHSTGRRANLVLITDAQVGNEAEILGLLKSAPDLPVHCFGIDIALNDALLLALAKQQGGTFHSLNPNDDIERAVTELGRALRQPVLLGMTLSEGWELADHKAPDLYAGQVHYLSARGTGEARLALAARDPGGAPVRLEFARRSVDHEGPYLHWCRARLQSLMARREAESVVALSKASNLICGLTAFVAWDEQEKVAVATHELVQPSLGYVGASAPRHLKRAGFADHLFEVRCAAVAEAFCSDLSEPFASQGILRAPGGAPAPVPPPPSWDPRQWEQRFEAVCVEAGLAERAVLCQAIAAWLGAAANEKERASRVRQLERLLHELGEALDRWRIAQAELRRLVVWLRESGEKTLQSLRELDAQLASGAPSEATLSEVKAACERGPELVVRADLLRQIEAGRQAKAELDRQIGVFAQRHGITVGNASKVAAPLQKPVL